MHYPMIVQFFNAFYSMKCIGGEHWKESRLTRSPSEIGLRREKWNFHSQTDRSSCHPYGISLHGEGILMRLLRRTLMGGL